MWLDLPRRIVMRQVVGRTLRRIVRRELLWNGNRELLRNVWARDPERSIIRWARFVRLRSHAEADDRLDDLRHDP